jgi:hypothetical protein
MLARWSFEKHTAIYVPTDSAVAFEKFCMIAINIDGFCEVKGK